MPSNRLRVAVVQACSQAYSVDKTLDKLETLVDEAKTRHGAQLAVFPEAFVGGYPRHSSFGAVIGSRTPEGREEFLRYHNAAIAIPSPALTRMEMIAAKSGVLLVVGVIEKDGGTLYCTVVFVDPKEGYVGKHRKLQPTASERLIWGQGTAETIDVFERSFDGPEGKVNARMSAAICWENYMPGLRMHYYTQHTQLYCAPTVDSRPVWQSTMVHIALEGRCFVLAACQFAQQKDYPADHAFPLGTERDPEGVMIAGGSVIVGPLGEVLAGPLLHGEGVLAAEIDLDDIIRGQFDLDVVGHYARPDIFEFKVKK